MTEFNSCDILHSYQTSWGMWQLARSDDYSTVQYMLPETEYQVTQIT